MRQGSWPLNILICLYCGLCGGSLGKVIPLITAIDRDFGTTPAQSAWLISMTTIVGIIIAPFGGRLSARFGDRAMLTVALAIGAAGSFGGALSTGFATMAAARIVEGIAFFLILNSAMTFLIKTNDGARRSGVLALFVASIPFGVGISSGLAGLVAETGWKLAFWGHGAALLVALLSTRLLPQADAAAPAAGEAPAGIFKGYLRLPPVLLGLTIGLFTVAQFGSATLIPTFYSQAHSLPIAVATGIGSAGLVMGILGNFIASFLLMRGWRGGRIAIGCLLVTGTAGVVMFMPAAGWNGNIVAYFIFMVAAGCGSSSLMSLSPSVASSIQNAAQSNALINQFNNTGLLLAPPIVFAAIAAVGPLGVQGVVAACTLFPIVLLIASGLSRGQPRG